MLLPVIEKPRARRSDGYEIELLALLEKL